MCGRTAQTQQSVQAAAISLQQASGRSIRQATAPAPPPRHDTTASSSSSSSSNPSADDTVSVPVDNYNLSPGMEAVCIYKNPTTGEFEMGYKTWGLVTKPGSKNHPTPPGMAKHFNNLMFNARSDTLFEKPTFSRLLSKGQTCLIAVDGFFEWKAELKKGKKQPYYVYRKPYLLFAGLWASIPTGVPNETLDTFTILTTEVCQPLEWLHSRMPVCVWDERLAMQWLTAPSRHVHQQLARGANQTSQTMLQWHAVSPDMTSLKFRTADAIKALPKLKSIQRLFAAAAKQSPSKIGNKNRAGDSTTSTRKETDPLPSSSTKRKQGPLSSSRKKLKSPPKKGRIDSFFQPKG